MFDISWSEFLLIGVVALVVIGPKELPAVMRTLGQWTRKVRGMAAEFQNQFQEAMREAEMADLKQHVDDLAQDVKSFDPTSDVRADFHSVGEGVKDALAASPEAAAVLPAADTEPALTQTSTQAPAPLETVSAPTAESSAPPALPAEAPGAPPARELESVGARPPPASTENAERPAPADATGRTG